MVTYMVNELKRIVHEDQSRPYIMWVINHIMIKRIYLINLNMSYNYQLQINLRQIFTKFY